MIDTYGTFGWMNVFQYTFYLESFISLKLLDVLDVSSKKNSKPFSVICKHRHVESIILCVIVIYQQKIDKEMMQWRSKTQLRCNSMTDWSLTTYFQREYNLVQKVYHYYSHIN